MSGEKIAYIGSHRFSNEWSEISSMLRAPQY